MAEVKKKPHKLNYLVCVNQEKYSEVALHFACKMAARNKGNVIILHVMEPSDYQSFGGVAEKIREEKRAEAETLLATLGGKVQQWSGLLPVLTVREGLIEEEIIDLVANDRSINMMVLGVAPETSTKSKVLPPLVSALSSKLLIPMMIIPGNLTPKQIEELAG